MASRSWRSSRTTCQPRLAKLLALAQPDNPPPMTRALRSVVGWGGRAYQGLTADVASACSGTPRKVPRSISHLWPMPGVRRILKPASFNALRTQPVLVKVLMVASGAASRASCANSSGVHMSGFFAGAKPSRNHASTCASSWLNCSSTSPISSVSVTRPLPSVNV